MPTQSTACSHCSASKSECDRLKADSNGQEQCCYKCNHTGLPQ